MYTYDDLIWAYNLLEQYHRFCDKYEVCSRECPLYNRTLSECAFRIASEHIDYYLQDLSEEIEKRKPNPFSDHIKSRFERKL